MTIASEMITGNSAYSYLNSTSRDNDSSGLKLSGKTATGSRRNICLSGSSILCVGTTGSGKSTQIKKLIDQAASEKMSQSIIFDPKGEFAEAFYDSKTDHIIDPARKMDSSNTWNIINDIEPGAAVREAVEMIFKDSINKSKDSFFPQSAAQLTSAIWNIVIENFRQTNVVISNGDLIDNTIVYPIDNLISLGNSLKMYRDVAVIKAIDDSNTQKTAINIKQEMQRTLLKAFDPDLGFYDKGTFSFRKFLNRGTGKLFIVYDIAWEEQLRTCTALLLDMMMKNCISVSNTRKDIKRYWFLDEFARLPEIAHLDALLNFGRSFGNKVIAGVQNIPQMYDTYGESRSRSMLSSFNNVIMFRSNDGITLGELSKLRGERVNDHTTRAIRDTIHTPINEPAIPCQLLSGFSTGEAVVSMAGTDPYYIRFDE